MADRILYPNTIDHLRYINHNLVDNAFRGRTSFVLMPSLYQYAYMLTYETGELPIREQFAAPDETATSAPNTIQVLTIP